MEYPDIPGAAVHCKDGGEICFILARVAVIVAYGGYKLIDKALDNEEQPEKEDEKDITIDVESSKRQA